MSFLVSCSGNKPLFTGSGMDTVYIAAAGSYLFSLSQGFEKECADMAQCLGIVITGGKR